MSEARQILSAWISAEAAGEEWALATVVRVEGSSYRKPGARMLLARSGVRSGMVSGGCLEGEISRKIWWLTESGPVVEKYVSSFDDDAPAGDDPNYGLGCGGTVYVLMERAQTARPALHALRASIEGRQPSAIATVIQSAHAEAAVGRRVIVAADGIVRENTLPADIDLLSLAKRALEERRTFNSTVVHQKERLEVLVEYIAPPFALTLYGAGDDAQPLAELAHAMGWHTTVADGRLNLVRAERFPHADALAVLDHAAPQLGLGSISTNGGAVLLTHSYLQDRELLRVLLPLSLRYLGVLGPRSRTLRIIEEIAPSLHLSVDECMSRLHAPVGLDLGADTPTGIALAIVAEIQAALQGRSAIPLREKASSSTRR